MIKSVIAIALFLAMTAPAIAQDTDQSIHRGSGRYTEGTGDEIHRGSGR